MSFNPGTLVWTGMLIGTGIILLLLIPDMYSASVNMVARRSAHRARRGQSGRPTRARRRYR